MTVRIASLLLIACVATGAGAESPQILRSPQGPAIEQWLVTDLVRGPGGGYWGSRTVASTPFSSGRCVIGAQMSAFRAHPVEAAQSESSAFFSRELYHVKAVGRVGTSTPNALRSGYHLAQGEAIFTFYGAGLGPEHSDLAALVWESSGPAPSPASLDKTWVTTFHVTYTNTDHHLEPKTIAVGPSGLPPKFVPNPLNELVLVQNTWQFELKETWRDRTSIAFEGGGNRYNKQVPDGTTRIVLNNIQYRGNVFAMDGWPNNHVSAEATQVVGNWKAWGAITRLNFLGNELNFIYGGGLDWRPDPHWRLNAGYHYNRRRRTETRRGLSLGLSYVW